MIKKFFHRKNILKIFFVSLAIIKIIRLTYTKETQSREDLLDIHVKVAFGFV